MVSIVSVLRGLPHLDKIRHAHQKLDKGHEAIFTWVEDSPLGGLVTPFKLLHRNHSGFIQGHEKHQKMRSERPEGFFIDQLKLFPGFYMDHLEELKEEKQLSAFYPMDYKSHNCQSYGSWKFWKEDRRLGKRAIPII